MIRPQALDDASVVAEVRAAFEAYEQALLANDVGAMDTAFWDDERLVRYGIGEIQHGYGEVAAWRATATPVPANRRHERVGVTAFGPDLAVVSLEFRNGDAPSSGRQSQVWARLGDGWRVVHAHVSVLTRD
jgi:ketosteroid isomerase-like protein